MALLFYPRSGAWRTTLFRPEELAAARFRETVEIRSGHLVISAGASLNWDLERFAGTVVGFDDETNQMVLRFFEQQAPELYSLRRLDSGYTRIWLGRVLNHTGIKDPQEFQKFSWQESGFILTVEDVQRVPATVSV